MRHNPARSSVMALATDFAYLLTAMSESRSLRGMVRQWARLRYRALAPRYDRYITQTAAYGAPLHAALDRIPTRPGRVLDVSTGTGYAAEAALRRYPDARIAACDLSPAMLSLAGGRLPGAARLCCDSAAMPFSDGAFDLVILQNAPPPVRELARVVAPGGWLVLSFSAGGRLPAWMASSLLRRLRGAGFADAVSGRAGGGLYVIAHRYAWEEVA